MRLLFLDKQKQQDTAKIEDVIEGERLAQIEAEENRKFIGGLIPLETFLVKFVGKSRA